MRKKKRVIDPVYGIDDEIEQHSFVKHEIKHTKLPDGHEKVKLDNVVNVSEGVLQQILDNTDFATRKIVGALLERGVPLAMSYDNATSYAEAVLRDGLNIDVEIDDDITKIIDSLNKLSVAYMYSRMVKLPKSIRRQYIQELTTEFVKEAMIQMKVASNTRKYSQTLRETVAHVTSSTERKTKKSDKAQNEEIVDNVVKEVQNSVGVKKSRR